MSGVQNANFGEHKIKKRRALRPQESEKIENEEIKFLEILAVLLDKNENDKENEADNDAVDGLTDSILSIAERLTELLECDFESLEFPRKVIKVLKKLKAITDFFNVKKTLLDLSNI